MTTSVRTPPVVTMPVDPRSDPGWARLAMGPRGHLFVSPPWIEAICGTYGFEPHARVRLGDDGRPVGGFAWVGLSDMLGDRTVSLPFSERVDPPVDDLDTWRAVTDEAFSLGPPVTIRVIDDPDAVVLRDDRLERVGLAAWHGTPLGVPLEEIGAGISAAARRNLRTSERKNVRVVASEGLDALRSFHELHVALRKNKYGLLAQPVELFERLWAGFAPLDGIVTLLARVDDVVVAGGVYLEWNGTLYHKFGASRTEYRSLCPNNAVTWAAIRWACERGLDGIDWGLSDLDQPGLVGYKRQWASTERRIVTVRSQPVSGPGRDGLEARRLLSELSSLFADATVPDEITARAGGLLYRYFC
ncbi:CelD/BcsL family acetyltransferase involved in cellulose biosynthesis [Pseudonocardia sediminis]|uniref:CelD/BcsL family acetyltransferase involved in cellulose biosynthesis n=1 Tax=Pseudonocardia sediminis TaxID=1397368 RepID=A0A4Q7V2X3_PSEST|nr:GNAT family N-acetyltransferase [Pseudonocardia sediminis]RZT87878.1 CelD/BcsL family acetyltransferase involved in cellulose biosynthesis [Pseudonocardia sediminis]